MSNRVLVVVDMQNDFCTGSLANEAAVAVIPAIKAKIEEFRKEGLPIIYTKDTHGKDYLETPEGKSIPVEHCIKGTVGWEIVNELAPAENDLIIEKNEFGWDGPWSGAIASAIDGDNEDKDLKETALEDVEVEMAGTVTSICVQANGLEIAKIPGVSVSILKDCCADFSDEKHNEGLKVLKDAGCKII